MLALVCKRDAFNIHPCKCFLQGSLTEGLKSSDFRLFFDKSSQRLDCRQDIDDFGRGGDVGGSKSWPTFVLGFFKVSTLTAGCY